MICNSSNTGEDSVAVISIRFSWTLSVYYSGVPPASQQTVPAVFQQQPPRYDIAPASPDVQGPYQAVIVPDGRQICLAVPDGSYDGRQICLMLPEDQPIPDGPFLVELEDTGETMAVRAVQGAIDGEKIKAGLMKLIPFFRGAVNIAKKIFIPGLGRWISFLLARCKSY